MFSHIDTNYIITYDHKHQVGHRYPFQWVNQISMGNSFSFLDTSPGDPKLCGNPDLDQPPDQFRGHR